MSLQPSPDRQGVPVTTNLAAPWALIQEGRPRPGRRAPTRLAYLTQAIASGGEVRAYRGVPVRRDGTPSPVPAHRIEPADVIATFRNRPTLRALGRVRAGRPRPRAERREDGV